MNEGGDSENLNAAGPLRGAPAVVVLAPLALVASRLLAIGVADPFTTSTGSGRFLAVELLSFATTVMFLPAALFLAWLGGGAQSRAPSIGAALVVLGVVGGAGVYALDFASIELARAGRSDEMRSIFITMLANPGVGVLRSLELSLPIGLLVLAWALWRQHVTRWPVAFAVAVGVVLSNALPAVVAIVGTVLLLAGLTAVALDGWRRVLAVPRARPDGKQWIADASK